MAWQLFTATSIVLSCWSVSARAAADFPCPKPTEQVATNVAGEVQGKAQGLLKVVDAELKGEVNKTVVNLWEKYPDVARIAIVQNLESSSCNFIKTSTLTDEQKIDKWIQMLPMFSAFLPAK